MMTIGIPKRKRHTILDRIHDLRSEYYSKTRIWPDELWLGVSNLSEFIEELTSRGSFGNPSYGWRWHYGERTVEHRRSFYRGMAICRAVAQYEICVRASENFCLTKYPISGIL